MLRIGVIGGGIAGFGAAWSLARAGHRVELFEARDDAGGNARIHGWQHGGHTLTAGLAVLAWPEAYFRNYERLLDALDVARERVRLRFFVNKEGKTYAHERGGALFERHRADFDRWKRMVARVRSLNARLSPGPASLYRVSYGNPLTYVSAWRLAQLSGISRAFWDDIVVSIYSSSFLTARLDTLPAFILPTIDDLLSIEDGGRMSTWREHSGHVFDKLGAALERVHLGRAITRIEVGAQLRITDVHGEQHAFDRVVLAADAGRMAAALPDGAARRILSRVTYVEQADASFTEGRAHADASLLPAAHRDLILADYCTAIDLEGGQYRNHFVVSSWAPVARRTGATMIVSYNQPRPIAGPVFPFSNRGAHPELSLRNLWLGRRLRRQQGRDGIYYCGAYTTPGNGHDLSLLSGFVAASALGAPHPFADEPEAHADFHRLHKIMLPGGAQAPGAQALGIDG